MRNLLASAVVVMSFLAAACGGTSVGVDPGPDASADAAACSGTPPLVCDGCCGSTYAADQCLNGAWTCRPLGGACAVCDGGGAGDSAGSDALAGDSTAGDSTASDSTASDYTASDAPEGDANDGAACAGDPPLVCNGCCGSKYAADQCVNGAWTCRPLAIACVICDAGRNEAAVDAGSDDGGASACGLRDDAGVAHSGSCPEGDFCCDQSHTGATAFVCRANGQPCVPVP